MTEVLSIEHAAHRLCAALHVNGIDPNHMEIVLPYEAWWRLWTSLEQKYRGMMKFDGRGSKPVEFQWMGVTYRAKDQ